MTQGISPIRQEQEKAHELNEICLQIIANTRNELYLHMRYLDVALHALLPGGDDQMITAGTDGTTYRYHPEYLGRLYQKGRVFVNRAYLHTLFHCLFCHMYTRKDRDEKLWNLACDIAIESVIDSLYQPCVHLRFPPARRELYNRLDGMIRVLHAEAVYHCLETWNLHEQEINRLGVLFLVDDHSLWPQDPTSQSSNRQRWEDIRHQMEVEMEAFSTEASSQSKSLLDQVKVENRERYDYKEFLRKFSVWKETVQVDPDSFDYIYYDYGIKAYGNMPLFEPLETREQKRIEEFVVVVDTSMSCQGELIKAFLQETYSVLQETESYFKQVNIHIIQCDDKVQQDQVIHSQEELQAYMEHFQVVGQGGTDFRPAFDYVNQLIQEGAFVHLRGLIYFTDGYGMFPIRMPAYDTAFIFLQDQYLDEDVPAWAIKIVLDPRELGKIKENKS